MPPAAGAISAGSGSVPTPVPADLFGMPLSQWAFWLEALLLSDPSAAALGEEMAWAVLPALPPGNSALAIDLLLAR
jgi:hypothetical protein